MKFDFRSLGKQLSLSALSNLGVIRASEFLTRRKLLVLTYHRVIDRSDWQSERRPPNTIFVDEFHAQMEFVARRFHVPDADELRGIIEHERVTRDYSLVITFDDGYENNYTHALPILKQHGFHAIFFVTSGLIGRASRAFWFDRLDQVTAIVPFSDLQRTLRDIDPSFDATSAGAVRRAFKRLAHARQAELLDLVEDRFSIAPCTVQNPALYRAMGWEQVKALASAGMTIGSHTQNHQILSAVPREEAFKEAMESRRLIQDETGRPCWCFGYPNGQAEDFRASDQEALRELGYLCAFTQISGVVTPRSPRYALPRIPVPDVGDLRIFRSHVSGLQRTVKAAARGY